MAGSEKVKNWKTEFSNNLNLEVTNLKNPIKAKFAPFFQIVQFIEFYSFQYSSEWGLFDRAS